MAQGEGESKARETVPSGKWLKDHVATIGGGDFALSLSAFFKVVRNYSHATSCSKKRRVLETVRRAVKR